MVMKIWSLFFSLPDKCTFLSVNMHWPFNDHRLRLPTTTRGNGTPTHAFQELPGTYVTQEEHKENYNYSFFNELCQT